MNRNGHRDNLNLRALGKAAPISGHRHRLEEHVNIHRATRGGQANYGSGNGQNHVKAANAGGNRCGPGSGAWGRSRRGTRGRGGPGRAGRRVCRCRCAERRSRRSRRRTAARAAGRKGGQFDGRRRRRLGRQIDAHRFLLRLDLSGFFLGRNRAGRNVRNILSHKINSNGNLMAPRESVNRHSDTGTPKMIGNQPEF
jgi:hypothetical protein